ncbi:hypothetical protein [Methyloglobulus sp.]|uniref:hypothetical protein n=1 Tax=Methyloglobulus sp. TaxID=2518622 RepID=UPI0032B82E3A
MKRLISAIALALICNPAFSEIKSLTIDSATVSKSTKEIVISGTVVCTPEHVFFIGGTLVQIKGPTYRVAGGSELLTCTGGSDPWTIQSPPSTEGAPIMPGNAQFLASDSDFTEGTFEQRMMKLVVHPAP